MEALAYMETHISPCTKWKRFSTIRELKLKFFMLAIKISVAALRVVHVLRQEAVVAARRGGLSATFDELNKFFTISGMPVASGQYWNSIHGREAGEAAQDIEGLQGMRTLANNMTFLMKSIALGKEAYELPEKEPFQRMNFIR